MISLASTIQVLAKERGMSISELADKMGVNIKTLYSSIHGNPRLSILQNLAEALNVRLSDIIAINENVTSQNVRVSKAGLLEKLQTLTTEFHILACELDISDERTEVFEIYEVLRRSQRRGAAGEMLAAINPHLCPDIPDDAE